MSPFAPNQELSYPQSWKETVLVAVAHFTRQGTGLTMASSSVSSSTRLVVNSTSRVRKTRTVVSSNSITSSGFRRGHELTRGRHISSNEGWKVPDVNHACGLAAGFTKVSSIRPCGDRHSSFARPLSVSSRRIATTSSLVPSQMLFDHQEKEGWDALHVLLSSATLAAATLAFVTATTSPSGTATTATASAAKFGRGGGGPGGSKPFSSQFTASSRERAEEDVRRLELESNEKPYAVRCNFYLSVPRSC